MAEKWQYLMVELSNKGRIVYENNGNKEILDFLLPYNIKPNVDQRIFSNSEGQYLTLHYFSNQTKCKPKPPCRSFDLYEANQMETKRKNFEKIKISCIFTL